MHVLRWSHRNELRYFQDEMKRVFDDFFSRLWEGREDKYLAWEPAIDVSETDNEILVEAELPGMKKDDVKIALGNSTLTIKGERKQEEKKKQGKYHSTERYYGSFYRAIDLPSYVDEKNIQAKFKDGVLKVTMPKKKEAKSKEIEIGVE
jgi:HSP20 family protein